VTYSIVARSGPSVGVATCSHSPFLASKTLHLASVGEPPAIVVSQAFSSPELGRAALADLRAGIAAGDAGLAHLRADPDAELRQLLVVDLTGLAVTTGAACVAVAADAVDAERTVAVGGNMLADDRVVPAMAEAAAEHGGAPLADRLLAALAAAHDAGGDVRGDRSAALVVIGGDDELRLAVDHHPEPLAELTRLREVDRADRVVRRCTAWLTSGADADPALVATVDGMLAGGDVGVEAWSMLLHGARPETARTDRLARIVAELERIRVRAQRTRQDRGDHP